MVGNVVTTFSLIVSSLDNAFFFSVAVSLAEGEGAVDEEDEEGVDDEESVSVSRGGVCSVEVASSEDELPPPKNPFNFPIIRSTVNRQIHGDRLTCKAIILDLAIRNSL